ncbi:hypothetical protein D3C72_1347980 [compost metagenome]
MRSPSSPLSASSPATDTVSSSASRPDEKKLVGGSCISSPTTMICGARYSAGTASSTGIWLASSKITTSKRSAASGSVSDTDSGLISQMGFMSRTTRPVSPLASSRIAL